MKAYLMTGDVVLDDIHHAGCRSRTRRIVDDEQYVPGILQEILQARGSDRICQCLADHFGFIADFHFVRLDDAEDALLVYLRLKRAIFAVGNLQFHYSLPLHYGTEGPDFIHEAFRRFSEFARIPLGNFDHLKAFRVDSIASKVLVSAFMRALTLGLPPCSHSSSGQQQINTPQAPRSRVSRTVCDFRRPLQAVTRIWYSLLISNLS